MAEPLSPADRSSLAAEVGPVNMSVGGVLIFENGSGLRQERILERIESRLHLVPRYRQRLRQPAPGVTNPAWADDDDFELTWHVRRAALPTGNGDEALADLVGVEMSRKLDRDRPLWELTVIEGLSFGRVAILFKMHHALVDGIAAVEIGMLLLDPAPEPLDVPPPETEWRPIPYDRNRHIRLLAQEPARHAQRLIRDASARALSLTDPRRALRGVDDVRRATELLTEIARQRPSAPPTPLNNGIGPNRRFAMHRARLTDLRAVGKAAGGTLNDALLAAVAGMLRSYLDEAGVTPRRPPVALVPVSVRDGQEGGNHISTVLVDLPTAVDDPLERVRAINATMNEIKDSAAIRAGALMVGAAGWAPPLVSSSLARAMGGARAFNLVVSNVPGPQQPFYLNGCKMLAVHPVVPLNPAFAGLSVGVLSYDGWVCFGLLADRDLDPPLSVAHRALKDALDAQLAAVP